jgi:hypothetical protein
MDIDVLLARYLVFNMVGLSHRFDTCDHFSAHTFDFKIQHLKIGYIEHFFLFNYILTNESTQMSRDGLTTVCFINEHWLGKTCWSCYTASL